MWNNLVAVSTKLLIEVLHSNMHRWRKKAGSKQIHTVKFAIGRGNIIRLASWNVGKWGTKYFGGIPKSDGATAPITMCVHCKEELRVGTYHEKEKDKYSVNTRD